MDVAKINQVVGVKKYRGDDIKYTVIVANIKETWKNVVYYYVYNQKTHIYEFFNINELEEIK